MKSNYRQLGQYIRPVDVRNKGLISIKLLGISVEKCFIPSIANIIGTDLEKYKVVRKGQFAYIPDTSRRGDKIAIALLREEECIISQAYTVFEVIDTGTLDPEYLMLWFSRPEFDRYARFHSWGSARETFGMDDMKRVQIPIPPRETQRRLVDVWEGLDGMKRDNETQAAPLMELCMSYLKKLSFQYAHEALEAYIEAADRRNTSNRLAMDSVKGISINKSFIDSKANMAGVALSKYKIVRPHEFAFVTVTSRNGEKISLALNTSEDDYIVSATYEVFRIVSAELLPEYLYLWFLRPEFDRYARFHSWGSARETFGMDDMKRVQIPIPPKPIQQAIVDLYACAKECKDIAEQAGQLRRIAAPALMQKAMHLSTLAACP